MKPILTLGLLSCLTVATLIGARADNGKDNGKTDSQTTAKAPAKLMLPTVESADLNGKSFKLPDDFSAPRTLLLIAFEREHQELIDSWVDGLELKPTDDDWYELPVVGAMSERRQQSLDNSMRGGIKGEAKRARVVTLYTDQKPFVEALGKKTTDTIYVAVVAPDGEVTALEEGKFDEAKAKAIEAQWRVETTK